MKLKHDTYISLHIKSIRTYTGMQLEHSHAVLNFFVHHEKLMMLNEKKFLPVLASRFV